jgi:hypothetical protein
MKGWAMASHESNYQRTYERNTALPVAKGENPGKKSTRTIDQTMSTATRGFVAQTDVPEKRFSQQLSKKVAERVIHIVDEVVALVLSVLSVALVYWIMKKVFLAAGIVEESFKFQAVSYVILFVELSLVLKFLWRQLKGQ